MPEEIKLSDWFDEELIRDDDEQINFVIYRHPEFDSTLFLEDDGGALSTANDCLGREAEESEFTVQRGRVSKAAFEQFCRVHEWDG